MSEIKTKIKKYKKFEIPKSPFVEYLENLEQRGARGELAALRRGLQYAPGECIEMYHYVVPWLENVKSKWEKDIHYLIASLYAYHPRSSHSGNLGDTLRIIYRSRGESNSIEQRFVALLRSNPEDLFFHLRQSISILKSENIPVNWHELFYDLKRWPYESKFTPQEKWANSFWKQPKKEEIE
ncbi:MAG: type I-E CRISPR-associated protein Cse2/CasB [Candidatus Helarchaeota archaeon]|nr:type I-E CRISPR-associated protein Cse2/CasB [Candidatus Helarchaeota archaeon]